jgi:DNA-binding MarR family transcriptional regulator
MITHGWDRLRSDGEYGDVDRKLAVALERIAAGGRKLLRAAALAESLSTTQAELLLQIFTAEREVRAPATLAQRLDVSRPTVTDALATLDRKGLVVRQPHPADGRRRVLDLTLHGRAVAERLSGWDTPLVKAVAKMAESDRSDTLRALLDVIAELTEARVVSVARTCTTCRFFRPDLHPGAAPHHCLRLDAPLLNADLRVDCQLHERPLPVRAESASRRQ